MRTALLLGVLFWIGWNPPTVGAPAVSPLLVVGFGVGVLSGFVLGRRVGHRDAGKGLARLYVNRRWLGRVH